MKRPAIYSPGEQNGVPPEIQMLRLASGHLAAQAVHVFAALRIADLLHERPLSAPELAPQVNADAAVLERLLRYLASLDVVREEAGQFALTRLGKTLCSGSSTAIRDHALLLTADYYWTAFGGLLHSVQTGEAAFDHAYGKSFFEYLNEHPADAEVYNGTMSSSTRLGVSAILEYPFATLPTIVDVGGGEGGLLTCILQRNTQVRGTLFDAPEVANQVKVDPAVADRMTVTGGNFFEQVPAGADGYILRRILHDWDDEKSAAILRVIRAAIPAHGKLVISELAGPAEGESSNDFCGVDLIMLVCHKGRERNESDFKELFAASGFQLSNIIRTKSPFWIVEGIPA